MSLHLSEKNLPAWEERSNEGSSNDGDGVDDSISASDAGASAKAPPVRKGLGAQETSKVQRLRVFMFLILIATTLLCSFFIYRFAANNETETFEDEFLSQGTKVLGAFSDDSYRKLQAMESLSSSLTNYALTHNETWPFITIDNSASLLEPYLSLADAAALQVLPVIPADQRKNWEVYSEANQNWIAEDLEARQQFSRINVRSDEARRLLQNPDLTEEDFMERILQNEPESSPIVRYSGQGDNISPYVKNYVGVDTSPGPWIVWWQYAPVIPNRYFINFNRLAWKGFAGEAATVLEQEKAVLSEAFTFERGLDFQSTRDFEFTDQLLQAGGSEGYEEGEPLGYIYYPVFDTFERNNRKSVAVLAAAVYWNSYFRDVLPDAVKGIICVVKNSKGQSFTYQIDGKDAIFLGLDDFHDTAYDKYELFTQYSSLGSETDYTGVPVDDEYISYEIRVYPSKIMEESYTTKTPAIIASAIVLIFLFTTAVFVAYDCLVERRQKLVLTTANKTSAVVEQLFPENVRDRIINQVEKSNNNAPDRNTKSNSTWRANKREFSAASVSTRDFMSQEDSALDSAPIADFYPRATVMFADIVGFTSWCSEREPAQVFRLLETLYASFDKIAKKRRVFKVETVGDCYVAVAGLPIPRKDHAVVICRFARECLMECSRLLPELEVKLGPGTADLGFRVGVHTGAVTAGVIRGENARFQIFGDTVNTAARMESTGSKGKIQLSPETADALRQFKKGSWFVPREGKVFAKGKGEIQTYFLATSVGGDGDTQSLTSMTSFGTDRSSTMKNEDFELTEMENRRLRLVDWNVDILYRILKKCIAHRLKMKSLKLSKSALDVSSHRADQKPASVFEEVAEIIPLPAFKETVLVTEEECSQVVVDPEVVRELDSYVSTISTLYQDNPFHNFEHASHVSMSVTKLLSRIISNESSSNQPTEEDTKENIHGMSYGIAADPLTEFACVFSALIHDVDHTGVPNATLVKEKHPLALNYKNLSVAEQNSVEVAWRLLLDERYAKLLDAICGLEDSEKLRFRQLVVNMVMATDIVDKDLKALRNRRWDLAFSGDAKSQTGSRQIMDRKATIVIEHLIQASDVAHTMQHWHIYQKWNEKFFMECYRAYKEGRTDKDPSDYWYKGELGFFDFYIIPLAKKLKECGIFGVSSDEYLNYATKNREEYERRGEDIVKQFKAEAQLLY